MLFENIRPKSIKNGLDIRVLLKSIDIEIIGQHLLLESSSCVCHLSYLGFQYLHLDKADAIIKRTNEKHGEKKETYSDPPVYTSIYFVSSSNYPNEYYFS